MNSIAKGHRVSYPVVADLLDDLGYSLQGNRKTKEGTIIRIEKHSSGASTQK